MSDSKLNKIRSQYEEADSSTHRQENPDTTIDMDVVYQEEADIQRSLDAAESMNRMCIDIENSIEPPSDKNESIDKGLLANIAELKINVINVRPRKRYTILGIYDTLFGARPPEGNNNQRFTRQLWRQENPPNQPQQNTWTQYGPAQGQGLGYPPAEHGGFSGAYGYDGGGPLIYDPQSRNKFVALVMGIVFVMLLATAIFLGVVLATPELKYFFQRVGWMILMLALIGLMSVNCAMICSPCARRPPCNFICLIITVASMSVLSAKITSHYRTEIVLYAVVATAAVVLVCVILACSKFDFTSYMLYVVVIATAFSVIVMIVLFVMLFSGSMMKPILIVILVIGTLIQTVMLTIQLQMILGGRTIEISEADYALAAFLLYTSILDIFLKLVHILGLTDSN